MALSIKSARAEELARALAAATQESITDAVIAALEERLERVRREADVDVERASIDAVIASVRALPVLDDRPEDELLGYGEDGAFE